MARGKTYSVRGQEFPRQMDLDAAVKAALNSHSLNAEFSDAFLAAVINEHHDEVIAAGQRATGRFQYLDFGEQVKRGMDTADRYRGGKIVLGFFEPLGEWRDVTVYPWRKAVDPRKEVKRALREKISALLPHPLQSDRCAERGCKARGSALEYEHATPTFDEMAEECLDLATAEEISSRFGYSKFTVGKDEPPHCIPDEHPCFERLKELHESNEWVWLCKFHHRNVSAAAPSNEPTMALMF